jgi:hypothetical protein
MLIKTERIGDKEFTFGELSYVQIREFFGGGKKAVMAEVMLASMNNANPETPWTRESLEEHVGGRATEKALTEAIVTFSELELAKPGEAPAAG